MFYVRQKPVAELPEMRLDIITPSTSAPLEFALSPDGRYIVFVASGDGPQRLWLRALDKTEAQPLPGTEGAQYPFWSPDSRAIAFTAASKLKRIDIAGGSPQVLANTNSTRGGAWNGDGTIVFSATLGPLSRVSASGGEPVAVTQLDKQTFDHRFPQFLPDGRHFLYLAWSTVPENRAIYVGSLDSDPRIRLMAVESKVVYTRPGFLLFQLLQLCAHLE